MIILDKFRRTRNLNDYSGDVVSEEEAAACIRAAEALLRNTDRLMKQNRMGVPVAMSFSLEQPYGRKTKPFRR